jgi:hypothetical protein
MSKQADRVKAAAASLAALEDDFQVPAPKQYPTAPPPAAAAVVPASVASEPVAIVEPAAAAVIVKEPRPRRKARGRGEGGTPGYRVPPSREGRVPINTWTTETRRRAVKAYAASNGHTVDELMTEALDDLMKKRRIRES